MHQGQMGSGIFSDGYNFIKRRVKAVYEGPSEKPSSRLTKYLDSTTSPVVKLEVCRKPIIKPVHRLLDAVSLGGFSRRQKKLGYDDVYHSYLLVTTADGRKVKLEKNHVVEQQDARPSDEENQRFDIPLHGKQLTVRDMIDTASRGNESNFFKYRAGSNNCQKFVAEMVERNGLLPQEQESMLSRGLALQNSHHLVSALPGGTYLANAVTNTAAVADRLLHGDGLFHAGYPAVASARGAVAPRRDGAIDASAKRTASRHSTKPAPSTSCEATSKLNKKKRNFYIPL
jgi:hypothetical protein